MVDRGLLENVDVQEALRKAQARIAELENELGKVDRTQAARYLSVLDEQDELICRFDTDYRLTFVNRAYAARLGKHPDEMLGQNVFDNVPSHYRQFAIDHVRTLSSQNLTAVSERVYNAYEETQTWYEWFDRVICDEQGQILEYQSVGRDITVRKRQELLQAHISQVLQGIAENQSLHNILISLVKAVEVQLPSLIASFLLYKSDAGTLHHVASTRLADDFIAAVDGLRIGPQTGTCGTAVYEKRLVITEDILTDPAWDAYRDLASAHGLRACWSMPIIGQTDQVYGTFALYARKPGRPSHIDMDVMWIVGQIAGIAFRRKEEQEALRANEALLSRYLEHIPGIVWIIDHQDRYVYCNDEYAQSVDRTVEGVVGHTLGEVLSEAALANVKRENALLLSQGDSLDVDQLGYHMGQLQHWKLSKFLVPREGLPPLIAGIGIDITKEKQAEQALHEANNALEQRVLERTAELEHAIYEIREERSLLRTLIDAVPDFIYIKDLEHRIIVSNIAHTRSLLAQNPDFRPLMKDSDIFPPEMAAAFGEDDRHVVARGEPIVKREERTIGQNGEEIWALTTKLPLRNLKGEITGLIGVTQDITQIKASEAALQRKYQEERELQTYFRALHEISIELTNTDNTDLFFRRAVELGLSRLGFERIAIFIHDHALHRAVGTYGTNLSGKVWPERHLSIPLTPDSPFEIARMHPDRLYLGQNVPLNHDQRIVGQGWNAVIALSHGDENQGWLCADNLVSQKPITQALIEVLAQYAMFISSALARKRIQGKLVALSQRLELATQAGEIGIWDWDVQKDALVWDDRMGALYGLTTDQAPASFDAWMAALHPDDAPRVRAAFAATLSSGGHFSPQFRVLWPDESVRHIKANGVVLWDGSGKPTRMIGVNLDVTSVQQALEKEKELGELKSRFVSMASHEFRTPLATIMATTENILRYRDRMTAAQLAERLETTREQVMHMRDIMEDVLHLARIQSGRIDFRPSVRDVDKLCRDILEDLESQPENEGRIAFESTTGPVIADIDVHLMRQIIGNLVHNALKYSGDGSLVSVTLTYDAERFTLTVRDQGIGIPPEDLRHLFEPFHRAVNVGTISGTGLGLSIVKQAVDAHRGDIAVESTVNVGTTFTVSIPRTAVTDDAQGGPG